MAKSESGELIDPYGGQQDLAAKQLRHVSGAFTEDPLRVLRVARFAAKLHHLGFTVADETLQLMRHIVSTGEINELAPERIWKESQLALATQSPAVFFSVLHATHALTQTHSSISDQFEKSAVRKLGFASLNEIALQETEPCTRFAAMVGGLYYSNQEDAYTDIQKLTKQLPLPNPCKELLLHTANLQHKCHQVFELDEKQLLSLLHKLDARRKPERFTSLLEIFANIYKVATSNKTYPQADWLRLTSKTIDSIDVGPWIKQSINSKELADNLENAQLELIKQLLEKRNTE